MLEAGGRRVSVVIPTLGRGEVLLQTLSHVLELPTQPAEILVIDQTESYESHVSSELRRLEVDGFIRWVRRRPPSITAAMNHGLQLAVSPLVLFLDDDIVPRSDLVRLHAALHQEKTEIWASVGQIIQPWQKPTCQHPRVGKLKGLRKDFDFLFNSAEDEDVENTMAGNLCVKREHALALGGFDENFIGSAIQFETDFARRVIRRGGRIRFLGSAGIDHLAASSGGTRAYGRHLTCGNALHSVGGYYYAFRNASAIPAWWYCLRRCFRQIRTRFHFTHPWWIPVKLIGEFRAWKLALSLVRKGPKFSQRLSAGSEPETLDTSTSSGI